MFKTKRYVHDIYEKEQIYDESFESFCYQHCLKILLESKGVWNARFYINTSMSLVLDEEEQRCSFDTHENVRSLLPSCGNIVERYQCEDRDAKDVFMENIEYIVQRNEPIIVGLDSYYLPYTINYNKVHAGHTALLCGFDLHKEEVYLIDWYAPWLYKGSVALNDFLEARDSQNPYDGSLFSGTPIKNNWACIKDIKEKDVHQLFNEVIELSKAQYYCESKEKKQGVEALIGMKEWTQKCSSESDFALIYEEMYIGVKRHKFFMGTLQEYSKHDDSLVLQEMIEKQRVIINKWDVIWMLLLKLKSKSAERTKIRLLDYFEDLIDAENEFRKYIIKSSVY